MPGTKGEYHHEGKRRIAIVHYIRLMSILLKVCTAMYFNTLLAALKRAESNS